MSPAMTNQELMRVLLFARSLRDAFCETHSQADPDPFWNIVLYLITTDLRQQPVTISQLASVAGVPYTSARRRIERMIADGDIVAVPDPRRANSQLLRPSKSLWDDFRKYAERVKSSFIGTVGYGAETQSADSYFGHSEFVNDLRPPQSLIDQLNKLDRPLMVIAHDDNYFAAFRNFWRDYRIPLKAPPEFTLLPLPALFEEINRRIVHPDPDFDMVSITMPWLSEFAARGMLKPLDRLIDPANIAVSDFHPAIWSTVLWDKNAYGVPLFSTAEIFAVRSDLFRERDLGFPKTFDDILVAAAALHRPEKGCTA